MKKTLILALLASVTSYSVPMKGITETGDEVILRDDGTWSYVNPDEVEAEEIEVNPIKFTKTKKATFPVKSSKNTAEVWIDAKKWSFEKTSNAATEYSFQLKGGDLYALVINEPIQMELGSLVNMAIVNARSAAPDIKVLHKEYRSVNGKKLIYLQMEGTSMGMKASYFGYYYSSPSGVTQLLVYTGTGLVDKYRSTAEDFLNGLVFREESNLN